MRNSAQAWILTICALGAIAILAVVLGLHGFGREGQDEPESVAKANQSELESATSEDLNLHTRQAQDSSSGAKEVDDGSSDPILRRDPNALPEETRWLAESGQVDGSELFGLLSDDSFDTILDNLEARSATDPDAYEFSAVYSDFLDAHIQNIGNGEFELDGFACGLRTCIGQVGRQEGSESEWIKLGRLASSSSGPPVYLMYDQRVTIGPIDLGEETTVYRFFISIDPDTNSIELP